MISWITSSIISAPHAFYKRHGGVSTGPCSSLNFSGSIDLPENISINRKKALEAAGFPFENVCYLRQIHSDKVLTARKGAQEGDALVCSEKGWVLAISAADCFPLLFHDDRNGVIGAAHCGWKGTYNRIAAKTVEAMEKLGAEKDQIKVAVGPGICKLHYEVSEELITQFSSAGFSASCYEGRQLDLAQCNSEVLQQCGLNAVQIEHLHRCTYEDDFFSHRRDKGETGRMWAVIMLK